MGVHRGRRVRDKLSDRAVKAARLPGYYGDGAGLYLQVSPSGSKSWVLRYTLRGKSREMGLGGYPDVSMTRAREKRDACRALLADGADPLEVKREKTRGEIAAAAKAVTFKVEAEAYIEAHRSKWKNAKHADQWTNTLEAYAYPHIGDLLVSDIDTGLVEKCLKTIWTKKTETANRVRGRIESVLDRATALGHRTGDNPARWSGNLEHLLPNRNAIAKPENHAALPYAKVGEFMRDLRAQPGIAARAVEFIILTAARTSEVFNAQWSEVDMDQAVWTVPAERMKSKREHRVPLAPQALAVLKKMAEIGTKGYIFPGAKEGRPMSNMAGLELLKRMKRDDITIHGFRSTFRDWCAEQTNYPREVAEKALAHVLKDKTEAAYQRGDFFDKRAKLMDAWAGYCGRVHESASVTPIGKNRAARTAATASQRS